MQLTTTTAKPIGVQWRGVFFDGPQPDLSPSKSKKKDMLPRFEFRRIDFMLSFAQCDVGLAGTRAAKSQNMAICDEQPFFFGR